MPLHTESCTYTYRHWNITGDAQLLCGALCREATKEANSTEESTQVVDQSCFHWVKIVVPVHMPGKPRFRRLAAQRTFSFQNAGTMSHLIHLEEVDQDGYEARRV